VSLILILVDTENWVWPEKDRDGWKRAPDSWKEFYTHWRTATDCASLRDPDSPHLSLEPLRPEVDLPLGFPKTIFVRSYYLDLFKRVWEAAFQDSKGHLIIGQPGIGN